MLEAMMFSDEGAGFCSKGTDYAFSSASCFLLRRFATTIR